MAETFVTTMDNPYDYWTQFDEWYAWDTSHGYDVIGQPYNTLNYFARIYSLNGSSGLTDQERLAVVNQTVDEIVRMNLTGNYVRTIKGEKKRVFAS